MSNGPIEPSADWRVAPKELRQMYLALVQEGFTVAEAMHIVGVVLGAQIGRGGDG